MERTVEHAASEISADVLNEKLAKYWELHQRRDGLDQRLSRAEAEKTSVSTKIYDRVVADYQHELDSVASTLDPMRSEIDRFRGVCEKRHDDTRRKIAELEDQIAEAGFRQRVGEYTDSEVSHIRDDVNPLLTEEQKRLSEISNQLEAFDHPPASMLEKVEEPSSEPSLEQETVADVESVLSSTPTPTPSSHSENTVAPELVIEAPDPAGDDAVDYSAPAHPPYGLAHDDTFANFDSDDDDPLAALADPSAPSDSLAGIQRLVFISGPATGNTRDISPSTITVGREHDNAIELKDPDVARYHARIVYSSGGYYIEDLETSTGTWVNGIKHRRAPLSIGDVVRVGKTEFRFE